MDLSLVQYALIFGLGILASIINMMAGGGSNLILPVLMMFGLPPDIANGSNRVGVFLQSITGIHGFGRAGKLPTQDLSGILIPTLIGGICGSLAASFAPVEILKPLLLGTMLAVATMVLFKPSVIMHGPGTTPLAVRDSPRAWLWLWLASVYGGFVQAGTGFVLFIALAGVLRYDLVRANALKVVCTLGFTAVSLLVFIWRGQVWWDVGLVLAAGNMIGAKIGVKTALNIKPKTLKWVLFGMTLVAVVAALLF